VKGICEDMLENPQKWEGVIFATGSECHGLKEGI